MKENNVGYLQTFRDKTKRFTAPLVIGTAMSLTPITIDSDFNIDTRPNVVYSEKENTSMMYKKLSTEYPRMYNSNYAITSSEAIQKNETNETVATNGVSITHKYIEETGKWEKLDENLPWSTPETRIKNSLNSILKMNYYFTAPDSTQTKIPNPLDIDEQEVHKYLETKSDTGMKSFQILNNSKGEPTLILATNSKSRITSENKSIEALKKSFDFLNQVDPDIVDVIAHQSYVRAIAGGIYGGNLIANNFASDAVPAINTVCINGDRIKGDYIYGALLTLIQSRYVSDWKNVKVVEGSSTSIVKDRYDKNNYLDRFYWTRNWINTHKNNMTKQEFSKLSESIDVTISEYKAKNNL